MCMEYVKKKKLTICETNKIKQARKKPSVTANGEHALYRVPLFATKRAVVGSQKAYNNAGSRMLSFPLEAGKQAVKRHHNYHSQSISCKVLGTRSQ